MIVRPRQHLSYSAGPITGAGYADTMTAGAAPSPAPELSVILPCRASGRGLDRQLRALAAQQNPPRMEILLCDNGDTPDLSARARAALAEAPATPPADPPAQDTDRCRVRIIDARDHPGAAYARNCGIAAAQAPTLAFCDDDDLVHPQWARRAVELVAAHGVVTGGIVLISDEAMNRMDEDQLRRHLTTHTRGIAPQPAPQGSIGPALMGGNFAAPRETLIRVGGFDAALDRGAEDNELGFRLEQAGSAITDCAAMSILYATPAALRTVSAKHRTAAQALGQVCALHGIWDQTEEFRRPPLVGLGRTLAASAVMLVDRRRRDVPAAVTRTATSVGLTRAWFTHRVLRRPVVSQLGLGLGDGSSTGLSTGPTTGATR